MAVCLLSLACPDSGNLVIKQPGSFDGFHPSIAISQINLVLAEQHPLVNFGDVRGSCLTGKGVGLGPPRLRSHSTRGKGASFSTELNYERNLNVGMFNTGGELREAVQELGLLVQQGSYVDTSTFYSVLKRCMAERNLVLGKQVHALALQNGYESNAFLANHFISMYASHGKLEEAMQVFTKVALPNAYVWATIILVHARHEKSKEAIKLYRQMRESGIKPDNHIFVAVLKACANRVDLASGKEVHADILKSGVMADIFVGNSLVNMYAKCGSLEHARKVFDKLSMRTVVTWTSMIAGYVQHGLGHEALALYESMQQEGISSANHVTFVCLLQACASLGALHQGKQLHAQIQERGLEADLIVGNGLVDMYSKCRSLEDACRLFNRMPKRDVVTWNAMIAGYVRQGLGEAALALHVNMQQEGITLPNHVTFACLLQACACIRDLHQGKLLHSQIRERGLETDVSVANSLVNMYAKCRSLEDARIVFNMLPTKDVVTWTALITGYVQQGFSQEALALYLTMQQEGIDPANEITFVSLLQACANVGALHHGKQLHVQISASGLERDTIVGNSLVDMYAKCGSLGDARRLFDRLPTRNVVTWNALINGYAQHSDAEMAVECFREMQQHGVEPDEVTFLCLLVACSHAGLVRDGQQYFKMMVEEYAIVPTISHYSCMVDVFARSGCLNEAEDLLHAMPYENCVAGWTSLLSACKSHGDVGRGRRCFDQLVKLEPENATAYVLLGNIYASMGRWREVNEIEGLRWLAGAKKKPAKASIEVKNEVHEFTVGEERSDISSKLRSVNLRLKEEGGHVPQTHLVLKAASERDKEDALCGHAEKLALAYGLLNTPDGTTLLVTKNLRMCNDCHSSTKILSHLEKREIIVRDAHSFHRFQDGSCSCGDRG